MHFSVVGPNPYRFPAVGDGVENLFRPVSCDSGSQIGVGEIILAVHVDRMEKQHVKIFPELCLPPRGYSHRNTQDHSGAARPDAQIRSPFGQIVRAEGEDNGETNHRHIQIAIGSSLSSGLNQTDYRSQGNEKPEPASRKPGPSIHLAQYQRGDRDNPQRRSPCFPQRQIARIGAHEPEASRPDRVSGIRRHRDERIFQPQSQWKSVQALNRCGVALRGKGNRNPGKGKDPKRNFFCDQS